MTPQYLSVLVGQFSERSLGNTIAKMGSSHFVENKSSCLKQPRGRQACRDCPCGLSHPTHSAQRGEATDGRRWWRGVHEHNVTETGLTVSWFPSAAQGPFTLLRNGVWFCLVLRVVLFCFLKGHENCFVSFSPQSSNILLYNRNLHITTILGPSRLIPTEAIHEF